MRPFLFILFSLLLLVFLLSADSQKEGARPLIAFFTAIIVLAFLVARDRWRNPAAYKKKEKWIQRNLF